jgi:arabinofuranosyltransferase
MTRRSLLTLVLVAIAVATFVYHAHIYWSWTEDDAYISLRYAENLSRGQGLVFNPGERVEGYSNFAWVVLAAAAMRAGLDPVAFTKGVGLVSGVVALLLSFLLARRTVPRPGMTPIVIAFYLAISPVLVQHSVAGLETSFFAMLLVASVLVASAPVTAFRRAGLIILLFVLSLTRPEGPLMAAVILLVRALQNRLAGGVFGDEPDWEARTVPLEGALKGRAAVIDAAIYALLFGAYFVWRWSYFGVPFPNTYYAKVSGGLHGLIDGAQYTLDFLRDAGGPLFIGLALVPLALGPRRPAYASALAVVVAYFGFVLISGGDWMFHYRFFAHVLPVLLALVAAGLDRLLSLPKPGTLRAAIVYSGIAIVLLATTLSLGNTELRIARTVLPALQRHNYLSQNYEELGRWFHDNTPLGSTIAISDVGAVGYFSDRHIVDMFGLVDPHISRIHGRMHYKSDAGYVLSRQPDYIVLVSLNDDGAGYSFQRIPDYSMNRRPEFHDGYELIRTVPQYWQNEFVLVYKRRG